MVVGLTELVSDKIWSTYPASPGAVTMITALTNLIKEDKITDIRKVS